ncbi:MAG TPA: hypothetical protein VIM42_12320 [Clostridium sp.]
MSRFDELNNNIMTVLLKIIDNKNLCKLVNYNSYDPLSEADMEDSSSLLFDKIYPYPFTPDVDSIASTQINVMFDNFQLGKDNPAFKNNQLTFVVICHSKLWRMNGMLRPFAIMKEIDSLFNSVNGLGVGKMKFVSSNIMWVNANYSGYRISYSLCDFN